MGNERRKDVETGRVISAHGKSRHVILLLADGVGLGVGEQDITGSQQNNINTRNMGEESLNCRWQRVYVRVKFVEIRSFAEHTPAILQEPAT